jgi:hypothetical protein
MAARFWRIIGISTRTGGGLDLSEMQLYNVAARVDTLATLTLSHAPTSGVQADLVDDSTASVVSWSADQLAQPSFSFTFDFGGSPNTVTSIKFGSGTDSLRFVYFCTLESSDDGITYTRSQSLRGINWPGESTLAEVSRDDLYWDVYSLKMDFEGANGSTQFIDQSVYAHNASAGGQAQISTASAGQGNSSLALDGAGDVVSFPASGGFDFGTGDFTIKYLLYYTSGSLVLNRRAFNGLGAGAWRLYVSSLNEVQTGAVAALISWPAPSTGVWHEMELGRKEGTFYAFVDKTLVATATPSAYSMSSSFSLRIGADNDPVGVCIAGKIDKLRILPGICEHTSTFATGGVEGNPLGTTNPSPVGEGINPSQFSPAGGDVPEMQIAQQRTDAYWDAVDGGSGFIAGTTKEKSTPSNVPLSRRVRLFHEESGRLIRERWSDASGNYTFPELKKNTRYTVVAHDHTEAYRAVVADRVEAT